MTVLNALILNSAPLMTITPSLKGFFIGLIAGAVVLGAAAVGLFVLSQIDKVQRQS
ncbi:photosystem II reaction center protein PsbX [Thermosynechococcaceae cyanobacterium BACA0444]|uniref:Photosystem II reaction center protein X n=1 Tax=Pseudocalidococcus azoricus BACA0444 TaxID=2918990 RepID=A0AAE4JW25_9CYAN|nr:photosystem II reaction center protein PsbX [Pseudocalidococcus azoricus BACA0444]